MITGGSIVLDAKNHMKALYSNSTHLRYFRIAGITLQVGSAIPMRRDTFAAKFEPFEVDGPGSDTITVEHRFIIPDLNGHKTGREVYRREPWVVYKEGRVWIYVNYSRDTTWAPVQILLRMLHRTRYSGRESRQGEGTKAVSPFELEKGAHIHLLAFCSSDHRRLRIFNRGEVQFRGGNLASLTLFPTDQILLARILAQRRACFFHAGGVVLGDKGFIFAGHSGAGKTTIVTMMGPMAEVLCDDRMIVRRWPEGFKAHGTWSHGDLEDVSPKSALLKGIFFLNQARENRIVPLVDRNKIVRKLLACLVRPLVTSDWWDSMLELVEDIASEVPCFELYFDKSGGIVPLLRELGTSRLAPSISTLPVLKPRNRQPQ
jgi:hypothetical protein